jgi:hypothetical protein
MRILRICSINFHAVRDFRRTPFHALHTLIYTVPRFFVNTPIDTQ